MSAVASWLASRPAMLLYGLALGAVLVHPGGVTGPSTAADFAFQRGVPDAGIAEATPVAADELARDVAALVADGGLPDAKPWLKRHRARPDALTTGRLERSQEAAGTFSTGPLPPSSAPLPFHWHDAHHRFALDLPDLRGRPESATFRATQAFDIAIVGIARDGSPLRQEQVAVTELDPVTGERLGAVRIRELRYSYVPAPVEPRWMLGLGVGGSIGIAPPSAGPAYAALVSYRFAGPVAAWGLVAFEQGQGALLGVGGVAVRF